MNELAESQEHRRHELEAGMFASAVRALAARGYSEIQYDIGGKKARRRYVIAVAPDGERCSVWVKSATQWGGMAEALSFPWKKMGPSADGVSAVAEACRAAAKRGATHLLAISGDWQSGTLSVARLYRLARVPSLVAEQAAATDNVFYSLHSAALVIKSSMAEFASAAALAEQAGEDILQARDCHHITTSSKLYVRSRTSTRYHRDAKIRAEVLRTAAGRCECCGELGFVTEGGERYLETHHIVEISQRGPDSMTNIVAVCPSCHRKAHYAADRAHIGRRMLEAVRRRGRPEPQKP